jgi:hypothetical protein
VAEVVDFLEYLAPPTLASPRSAYGLQVGTALSQVKTLVVTPLATYNAIAAAATLKSSLLIVAAPLLSSPLASVRWDDPIGAKVAHLVQRQVSLYALANTYAAAPGGFDDSLAERLGLAANAALVPTAAESQLKFVVFVPPEDGERVRRAAIEAGAGHIGAYSSCSFQSTGMGTFVPGPNANPAVGARGKLQEVAETRLELLVPERELKGVIAAVLEAHPYEEVAYDIYPLRNPGVLYGRGRIGELPLSVSLDTVLAQVNDALGLGEENRARCSHRPAVPIRSLAAASGMAFGENLLWAAHLQEAGAIVTGGVSINDLMLADSLSPVIIDVGFAPSVAPGLQRLVAQLRNTFGSDGVQVAYVA